MQKHRHHSNPDYKKDRIVVLTNDSETPIGLLELMESKLSDRNRSDLKSMLKHRQVMTGNEIVSQFNLPIQPSGEVKVNMARSFVELRHNRLQLIYEDDDVIVVNKGYGLLSVAAPYAKKEQSAYDIVREYVKRKDPSNKLFVVHRLDRDTSGLMMFAKNEESQTTLRHNWNNYVLERLYVALLEGYVEQDKGFVKSRLQENSQYKVYSVGDDEEGKLAVTHYNVLKRGHGLSLVEFSLDTGRKNQIRVHAQDLGHPISGDRKYGAGPSRLNRLCLHARTLRFAHPVTKKDMHFRLPVPPRFLNAVGAPKEDTNYNDNTSKQ